MQIFKIRELARNETIDAPHGCALRKQSTRDIGADESSYSGYQDFAITQT